MAKKESTDIELQGLAFKFQLQDELTDKAIIAKNNFATVATSMDRSAHVMGKATEHSFATVETAVTKSTSSIKVKTATVTTSIRDAFKKQKSVFTDITAHIKARFAEIAETIQGFGSQIGGMDPIDLKLLEAADLKETRDYFVDLSVQAHAMEGALEQAFKRGRDHAIIFVKENERSVREVAEKYQYLGREVPTNINKAIKSLERFEEKSKKSMGGVLGTVDQLITKFRSLSLTDTAIGALAFGASKNLLSGAEATYKVASDASKLAMGGTDLLNARRVELSGVRIAMGTTIDEMAEVSSAFQSIVVGPKSFAASAQAAIMFSRATGTALGESAKYTAQLQQFYGAGQEEINKTVSRAALLAKTTKVSTQEIMNLYDELKFTKLAFMGNADTAKRLADGTAVAAAKMSQYGISVSQTAADIKGILTGEGGVSGYQKTLQGLILGGSSPEEAMQMLDDVANGVEGAQQRLVDAKNMGAAAIKGMTGGGALGAAMASDIGGIFGMSGEEIQNRTAAAANVLEKTGDALPIDKLLASSEAMAQAVKEFPTASENLARSMERAGASLVNTQMPVYDTLLKASEKLDSAAGKLAGGLFGLPATVQGLLGTVTQLSLAAIVIKQAIAIGKTLFNFSSIGSKFANVGKLFGLKSGEALASSVTNAAPTIAARFSGLLARGLSVALRGAGTIGLIITTFTIAYKVGTWINTQIDKLVAKVDGFRKVWYAIWDLPVIAFGHIWESAVATGSLIKSMIGGAWDFVQEKAASIADWLVNKFSGAWSAVAGFMQSIFGNSWNKIVNAFETVINKIKGIAGTLASALEGAIPDWVKFAAKKVFPAFFPNATDVAPAPKPVTPASTSTSTSAAKASGGTATPSMPTSAATTTSSASSAPSGAKGTYSRDYKGIAQLAQEHGFTVTSTIGMGQHNTNSKHYIGKAADVRTRDKSPSEISSFIKTAQSAGYRVVDERTRPPRQAVWSGPHLHVEVPGNTREMYAQHAAAQASAPRVASATPSAPTPTVQPVSTATMAAGTPTQAMGPVSPAVKMEPYAGTTKGEEAIIAELRRTNAILATQTSVLQRSGFQTNSPSQAYLEMNNGGMPG